MMDACQSPPSFSSPRGASHYDELSMKESLIFSDSLKDLKDLRKQLYSAAEYFESSYNGQDHKQIVVNTLRDYTTKAFINTVDHLGSMTYEVNCLLDDKIGEASAIELRFSCVQQRQRMCEMFIDHGDLSQQSLAIRTPKHHMRYILPGMLPFTRFVIGLLRPKYRKKRTSPFLFQLTRSSSLSDKSTSPNPSNAKKRVSINEIQCSLAIKLHFLLDMSCGHDLSWPSLLYAHMNIQYPSEPRRSTSMSTHVERNRTDIELCSSKNESLFKALLSMRKSRKDSKLYKFLDEN
ncbi:hypothetical protein EUGRSUZ_E00746 [Eucalyptus grandis]|uniref:Uncharacterized protein n=2 Tax=Eucalyptus grandis TaxID=71139 RepID=A0ACC3KT42_EUCGR|nr:hypothetical protein EUGRSUZ_E00746 [Eucalyptus grandis]